MLTAVFAAGLLQGGLDQEVNLVNAELLLRAAWHQADRGIAQRHGRVPLVDDGGSDDRHVRQHRAAGTVFGQHMPRLVALDDFRLEAYLDGWLLVFRHRTCPALSAPSARSSAGTT